MQTASLSHQLSHHQHAHHHGPTGRAGGV